MPGICEEFRSSVDALAFNPSHHGLTREREQAVHEHIAACSGCRKKYEQGRAERKELLKKSSGGCNPII